MSLSKLSFKGGRTILAVTNISRRGTALQASSRLQSTLAATALHDEYATAKPFSEMPAPKGLPFLGNMLLMGNKENLINATKFHKKLGEELGPVYKLVVPNQVLVFTHGSENAQAMYAKEGKYPLIAAFELHERVRKGYLPHVYKSAGLLQSGEEWLKVRQLVQQDMMRPKSAVFFIDDLDSIMDEMIEKLERETIDPVTRMAGPDVTNNCREFALDAVGVMFIGSKLGVIQGSEYGKQMLEKVKELTQQFVICMIIPPKIAKYVPVFKKFVQNAEDIYRLCEAEIDKALARHRVDGCLNGTVLGRMLERSGGDITIPAVMANDALLAGIDTTGNTLSILLYHLATNPEPQEKLYEEIVRVVGKNGKMTEAALKEMRYLKACQQESTRIAPVVYGTARTAESNIVIAGYQIPKGTMVLQLGALNSNSEKYFNNPDQFIPERWIRGCPQQLEKSKNAYSTIPFGHGPRACIGQRFAKLELYMAAFKLIQKYKISYSGPPLEMNYTGIGELKEPLKLKFEKRD